MYSYLQNVQINNCRRFAPANRAATSKQLAPANDGGLDAHEFPPLDKEKRRKRLDATPFSLFERKDAVSEAAMGPSKQRDPEGGQRSTEEVEEGGKRASATLFKRGQRGIAKQRRIQAQPLKAKMARKAARQEQAEAQAKAASDGEQGGDSDGTKEREGGPVIAREETLVFKAGEGGTGDDAAPAKPVHQSPVTKRGGGGAAGSKGQVE